MKPLSTREFEIVELTALGLSQKEIADHLDISIHTVDKTIRNAKEKLGCQKSTELSAWYFINKYHISLQISPLKRALLSLSFLAICLVAIVDDFQPERAYRTVTRTMRAQRNARGRRSETDFYMVA